MHRFLIVVCVLAAGCGSGNTSVQGTVTFNGVPVDNGYITFFPTDVASSAAAAPIRDGKYHVASLTPGPRVVEIVANKKIDFAASSAEMDQQRKKPKTNDSPSGAAVSAALIPADAVGNRQTIDIPAGQQTFDFHLKSDRK